MEDADKSRRIFSSLAIEFFSYPTNRGIDAYAKGFGMDREAFLGWLAGKKNVLDIGSGGGLLKKEVEILRDNRQFNGSVNIISLDLSYSEETGVAQASYATHLAFSNLYVKPTRSSMEKVEKMFKASALGGDFSALPFPDGFFDGVVASYSFGITSKDAAIKDKEEFLTICKEVNRVMDKKNGSGFVTVSVDESTHNLRAGNLDNPFYYTLEEIEYLGPELKSADLTTKEGKTIKNYYLVLSPRVT